MLFTPWKEAHCGELAYRVLHDELGLDVEEHDLWLDTSAPDLDRRVDEYLARQGERWQKLGDSASAAREVGDVLWSEGKDEFGRNHLSVIVKLDPVPIAITTSRKAGAAFLVRASLIQNVRGVYRFVGGALGDGQAGDVQREATE